MGRNNRRMILPLLFSCLLLASFPAATDAHSLGAEARLQDGRVHVEGYFDDDTASADARVWVEDVKKHRVAEGRMDGQGRWSFPAPAPGRYRVTVDAGGGHRATVTITIHPTETASPKTGEKDTTPSETTPVQVSEGKSREEFTRFPWQRLGLGLTLIGLFAFILVVLLRAVRHKASVALPGEKSE